MRLTCSRSGGQSISVNRVNFRIDIDQRGNFLQRLEVIGFSTDLDEQFCGSPWVSRLAKVVGEYSARSDCLKDVVRLSIDGSSQANMVIGDESGLAVYKDQTLFKRTEVP